MNYHCDPPAPTTSEPEDADVIASGEGLQNELKPGSRTTLVNPRGAYQVVAMTSARSRPQGCRSLEAKKHHQEGVYEEYTLHGTLGLDSCWSLEPAGFDWQTYL